MKQSRITRSGSAIFSERAWLAISRTLNLSGRELQILRGTFDGRTEFAIAADLGISAHTVHTHIGRLHRKLRVLDRVELVLRVTHEFLRLTTQPGSQLPPICAHRAAGYCPLASRSRTGC
jgi:DNA-binding CsgD family transcriptional regulator